MDARILSDATNIAMPRWMMQAKQYASLAVPIGLILLLGVIIVPLPPIIMDILIAGNLSLAAVILLTTVYVRSPLDFSVFPSLLLATTLFRLVINVASTRLILSAEGNTPEAVSGVAGQVIQAFGSFVTGGNVIVGTIIFIILIVVQFVVITKGATRISEVAARFTLDGMPGKQMAIDADLNAGVIDEAEARKRRDSITREADFYGAMDGASKFVRGDAIAGVIITLINIVGGFAIGVFQNGMNAAGAMDVFTRLTIGDGLVSQIPSFIIAIAAGLIVTRSSSDRDLGHELTEQLSSRPIALIITAVFLFALSLTGMAPIPLILIGSSIGAIAFFMTRNEKQQAAATAERRRAETTKPAGPPPVEQLLTVDTMELELGYGLVRLADASKEGHLLDRIGRIRRELAVELGLIVPPIRIHDNMQLQPNDYRIKIRNNTVTKGQVMPGHLLAMNTGIASAPIEGIKTTEPAFGMDAWWVDPGQRAHVEALNYLVVDATEVLATHITEIIKTHADELLTREETNHLIEQLREKAPKLVEEVIGNQIKPGDLQKVLQALLRERVPIRDMETIIETLADWSTRTQDLEVLTEYVRNALRRTICNQYIETDIETGATRLYCVTLEPAMEDLINGYIERSATGTSMTVPPSVANRITAAILTEMQKLIAAGHHPLVLASPQVRAQVRQLLEPHLPNVAVLAYNEVSKGVEVESMGLVPLDTPDPTDATVHTTPSPELEGVTR